MKTLIKNGRIVTAVDDYHADILVEGERITMIGEKLDMQADKVIDAKGMLVIPGGIDAHTHMDMPFGGTTSSDDFETGTRAAAHGGTTTIIDFAIQRTGEVVQDGSTADMVFAVDELIEFITRTMTLEPGDLIATGTPAGVGAFRQPPLWLKPGDEITVEIERVGRLTNPVVSA